jgi:hypothetical protein
VAKAPDTSEDHADGKLIGLLRDEDLSAAVEMDPQVFFPLCAVPWLPEKVPSTRVYGVVAEYHFNPGNHSGLAILVLHLNAELYSPV